MKKLLFWLKVGFYFFLCAFAIMPFFMTSLVGLILFITGNAHEIFFWIFLVITAEKLAQTDEEELPEGLFITGMCFCIICGICGAVYLFGVHQPVLLWFGKIFIGYGYLFLIWFTSSWRDDTDWGFGVDFEALSSAFRNLVERRGAGPVLDSIGEAWGS